MSSRTAVSRRPVRALLASVCALLGALGMSASALAAAPEAPVTVSPATKVAATSASLAGVLNPHSHAKVTWEMFLSHPGGSSCHEGITVGGEGPFEGEGIPVQTTAVNLKPSSVYRFCVVAFNGGEETSGNEVIFKTLGAPGAPELSACPQAKATEIILCAVLRPLGEEETTEPVSYHFLYKLGASCAGGTETASQLSIGEPQEGVIAKVPGIAPDTTYAFCLVVTTPSETMTYGPISFRTHLAFSVTLWLTGEGEVQSNPAGFQCEAEECSHEFESAVTLTATPKPGYVFAGWLGCRRTGADTCEVAAPVTEPAVGVEVIAVFVKTAEKGKESTNGENGKEGSPGKEGPAGKVGAQGPAGPTGSQGPAGPAGKVELVTCKKVKGKQHCTTKLVSGTVNFTTAGLAAQATLSRHGVVYAAGTAHTARGRMSLRLTPLRSLRLGKYTLTLVSGVGKHETIRSESFTLS